MKNNSSEYKCKLHRDEAALRSKIITDTLYNIKLTIENPFSETYQINCFLEFIINLEEMRA